MKFLLGWLLSMVVTLIGLGVIFAGVSGQDEARALMGAVVTALGVVALTWLASNTNG